jgi:hypothetical protein
MSKKKNREPVLTPEQAEHQRRSEVFAEGIFYVMEGHGDKLKEWVETHSENDYELVENLHSQIEVGQRNAVTGMQKFEAQIKNFHSGIDIIEDCMAEKVERENAAADEGLGEDATDNPEDGVAEPEGEVQA